MLVGTCQSCNSQYMNMPYADGRPKQGSACTIFLLCKLCRIACTQNRLSKQNLKHSRRWSTSFFLGSLTTKGRYRKATQQRPFCKAPFRAFIVLLSLIVKLLNPRISFSKPTHGYMFVRHKYRNTGLSDAIC